MNTNSQHGANSAPLVFCHFGNSPYLPYVFACARLSNPDKRIVLLGDESNRRTAERHGLVHHPYMDFAGGSEIETFERVYRRVIGPKSGYMRGKIDWIKFVFQRWFYVYNYVRAEKIPSFWHFDSDNMLLDDLTAYEPWLMHYDCTEQCNGKCMNGFISNPNVVGNYLAKINDVFTRQDLLAKMEQEFVAHHPTYAFTEMRAYELFKHEDRPRSFHLATPKDGVAFDDCICQSHGMEMERLFFRKHIKKVFLAVNGHFFCQGRIDHQFVRMASLNLSWVPLFVYDNVLRHRQQRLPGNSLPVLPDGRSGTLASCFPSWHYLVHEGFFEVTRVGWKFFLQPALSRLARNA